MNRITRFAIEHTPIITIMLVVLMVFGGYSVISLRTELFPDISMPEIYIVSIVPGADSAEMEQSVSSVIEEEMSSLPDLKKMSSESAENVSKVTLVFYENTDLEMKLTEVRYRLDRISQKLPRTIYGKPDAFISTMDMVPIFSFSVYLEGDSGLLQKEILDPIKKIKGVSAVSVSPGISKKVFVKLKSDELKKHDIPVTDVFQLLNYSSMSMPLGKAEYEGNGVNLYFDGRFHSLNDIENLTVAVDNTRLADIADVYMDYDSGMNDITVNGKKVFFVEVQKKNDGDIISISREIRHILQNVPDSMVVTPVLDYSVITANSLINIIKAGVIGVLISVLVIFLCIGDIKATFIISVSIPLCIFFTVFLFSLFGLTFNVLTLSGLVVSLGMIVDASIVMIAQIYRYRSAASAAVLRASDDVSSSIVASVFTTLAAFVPLLFLPGIVGKVFWQISLTLIFSIFSSMLVALIVVPYLVRVMNGDRKFKEHRLTDRVFSRIEKVYKTALDFCMKFRWVVLLVSVTLFALSVYYLLFSRFTFISSVDQSDLYMDIIFPSEDLEIDEKCDKIREFIMSSVDGCEAVVQKKGGLFTASIESGANTVGYRVILKGRKERKKGVLSIVESLQKSLEDMFPEAVISVQNGGFDYLLGFATGGGGFQVSFSGPDFDKVIEYVRGLEESVRRLPGVLSTETIRGHRRLDVKMDKQMFDIFGLTSYQAGMSQVLLYSSNEAGSFVDDDGSAYRIMVCSDIGERPFGKETLSKILIKNQMGDLVDLSELVEMGYSDSMAVIRRKDRNRVVTLKVMPSTEDQRFLLEHVLRYMSSHPLQEDMRGEIGGIMELISDAIVPVCIAIAISIFLVYVVIVIQEEKFVHPLIIMMSVPFCFIGIALSMKISGFPLSVMPLLAIVSLAGSVVNNGIILVDSINQLRCKLRECIDKGLAVGNADVDGREYRHRRLDGESERKILKMSVSSASASRIKPVIMTVCTTIAGVLPMSFDKSEGAELYAPLGQTILFGLLASTVITLFVIPCLYYIYESGVSRFGKQCRSE